MLASLLALAVALAAPPDSLARPCAGGQVLTAADLRAAGVGRLSDAVRLLDVVTAVSTDGFDAEPVTVASGRRRGRLGSAVRVLVDGEPVAGGTALDPAGLELVPVAPSEVEAVVFCPGPGLAAGAWGGPWLDVRTRPPARRAYGAVELGNETGDPGPARYLDPSLPNVDRLGPDLEAGVGAGGVWATVRDRSYYPTDAATRGRVDAVLAPGRFPKRHLTAATLAAPGLRLGVLQADDLPFLPAFGREVPVDRRSAQGTARASRALSPATRLGGRLHAARLAIGQPDWSAFPDGPAFDETRLLAGAFVHHAAPWGALAGGVQLDRVDIHQWDGAAARVARTDASAWAEAAGSAGRLALALSSHGGRVGGGARLDLARPLSDRVRLTLGATAGRTLDEAPGDGVPLLAPDALVVRDDGTVRLALQARLSPRVRVEATAEAQGTRVRDPLGDPDAAGASGLAHASATWTAPRLRVRVGGLVQGALAGDDAFRDRSGAVPSLRGIAEATLRPDRWTSLYARLDVRTAAPWSASRAGVPSAALLDLGVARGFYGDRLRASITGRNVLGAPEQGHPAGARLDPRLVVRLAVAL